MKSEKYNSLAHKSLESLVTEAQKGNQLAYSFIVAKYGAIIGNIAKSKNIYGVEFEDMLQEGAIGLMTAVEKFDVDKNVKFNTYANICIQTQMLDALKKTNAQKRKNVNGFVSLDDENSLVNQSYLVSDFYNPEAIMIGKENVETLNSDIKITLSEFERTILSMNLEGNSYAAIASKMNVTEKSVDNALQRVRKKLKLNQMV